MEPLVAGSRFPTLAPARRHPGPWSASGLHLPAVFVVGEEKNSTSVVLAEPRSSLSSSLPPSPSPSLSISLCTPEQRCLSHRRLTATAATRRPSPPHPTPPPSPERFGKKKNIYHNNRRKKFCFDLTRTAGSRQRRGKGSALPVRSECVCRSRPASVGSCTDLGVSGLSLHTVQKCHVRLLITGSVAPNRLNSLIQISLEVLILHQLFHCKMFPFLNNFSLQSSTSSSSRGYSSCLRTMVCCSCRRGLLLRGHFEMELTEAALKSPTG